MRLAHTLHINKLTQKRNFAHFILEKPRHEKPRKKRLLHFF